MTVISDKLFITQADFATYKDLSEHMDTPLMEAYIRESQVIDLQSFLGPELYLILQTDFTPPDTWATLKYDDLFNGSDYTSPNTGLIRQHGLQPMLTLFAYARMLDNISMSVTRIGAINYTEDETSIATTQAQIKTKVISTRALAVAYQAESAQFLRDNSTDYPEWFDRTEKNQSYQFIKL